MTHSTLIIGLTGGIASGKTTVSDEFANLGAPIIDADVIAHQIVEPGKPALQQIVEAFGKNILQGDGSLNRTALRQIVFADVSARKRLEGITHPVIGSEMQNQLNSVTTPYCILSIPLLVEGSGRGRADRILVVDCSVELQRKRLAMRDGSDETEIERILAAQATREKRLSFADDIINNNGNLEHLKRQIGDLHTVYSRGKRGIVE